MLYCSLQRSVILKKIMCAPPICKKNLCVPPQSVFASYGPGASCPIHMTCSSLQIITLLSCFQSNLRLKSLWKYVILTVLNDVITFLTSLKCNNNVTQVIYTVVFLHHDVFLNRDPVYISMRRDTVYKNHNSLLYNVEVIALCYT